MEGAAKTLPFFEEHSEDRNELGMDPKQLIVIGRTKAVPTRVFTARKELSNSIVNRINRGSQETCSGCF